MRQETGSLQKSMHQFVFSSIDTLLEDEPAHRDGPVINGGFAFALLNFAVDLSDIPYECYLHHLSKKNHLDIIMVGSSRRSRVKQIFHVFHFENMINVHNIFFFTTESSDSFFI